MDNVQNCDSYIKVPLSLLETIMFSSFWKILVIYKNGLNINNLIHIVSKSWPKGCSCYLGRTTQVFWHLAGKWSRRLF
jgi:hypothetical protein